MVAFLGSCFFARCLITTVVRSRSSIHVDCIVLMSLCCVLTAESSYTNFPLVTPDAMNKYFLDAGLAKPYSFDPPRVLGPVKVAKTYAGAQAALGSIALVSDAPDKALEVLPGRG